MKLIFFCILQMTITLIKKKLKISLRNRSKERCGMTRCGMT